MQKILIALAFSTTLAATPMAFAQAVDPLCMMKNADGTETVDTAKCPDGKTMAKTGDTAATPAAPAGDTTATTTPMAPAGGMTATPESFANAKIFSANDFIGKRVYSNNNDDLGEVNDLIFSDKGNLQAVILGVGGFLGIGEKDVAVNISSLNMAADGGTTKIMVDATKESLNAAPRYDRTTRTYVQ